MSSSPEIGSSKLDRDELDATADDESLVRFLAGSSDFTDFDIMASMGSVPLGSGDVSPVLALKNDLVFVTVTGAASIGSALILVGRSLGFKVGNFAFTAVTDGDDSGFGSDATEHGSVSPTLAYKSEITVFPDRNFTCCL